VCNPNNIADSPNPIIPVQKGDKLNIPKAFNMPIWLNQGRIHSFISRLEAAPTFHRPSSL
jgi:hypothetical protein